MAMPGRALCASATRMLSSAASGASTPRLVVATAQLKPSQRLPDTVGAICGRIRDAAAAGAQVLVVPEMATTGYDEAAILRATPAQLDAAEHEVRAACRSHGVAAVVGTLFRDASGRAFNSALVVGRNGSVAGHQHKMQLVPTDDGWCQAGNQLNLFHICGVPCAIIICHDKRFPELVRLPVLAGARCIFYLSAETWHDDLPLPAPREPAWSSARLEAEIGVYRAQTQARAVENRVWLVKANTAGCTEDARQGSHGMSSITDPFGRVRVEASTHGEEMLTYELDTAEADALYANKSLLPEYALSSWWRDGLAQFKIRHHHIE